MKTIQYQATCPNCGAPITTEICPYCNPQAFAVFCTEGKRENNTALRN